MKIEVTGLQDAEEAMLRLGSKDGTKVLRRSMLKANEPILARAKANAAALTRGSGALQKSLGMRFVVGQQNRPTVLLPPLGGRFTVQVMPMAGNRTAIALYNLAYRRRIGGIWYGHLIERGFKHRSGRQIAARPFLAPALHAETNNAIGIFVREMGLGIERATKRQARQQSSAS